MIKTIKMNLDDEKHLSVLSKALSSEVRIRILKKLREKEMNINEIAEELSIPASSAAVHVKVLEGAGLIRTRLLPGVRGSMKVCYICLDHIYIEISTDSLKGTKDEIIRMPVGSFVDFKVAPTCGLAGLKGPIGIEDEPASFYAPERMDAKLLWFREGFVEYRFPNYCLTGKQEKQLEFSAELCSEDHEYNLDCPSDITVWINGIDAGTYFCPSDFGGQRGRLNPEWWPDKNTQFGVLKRWCLNEKGTFLDDKKVSNLTIKEYHLKENDYISVRIGMKEDAKHIGGVNLFGDGFGNVPQELVMRISME